MLFVAQCPTVISLCSTDSITTTVRFKGSCMLWTNTAVIFQSGHRQTLLSYAYIVTLDGLKMLTNSQSFIFRGLFPKLNSKCASSRQCDYPLLITTAITVLLKHIACIVCILYHFSVTFLFTYYHRNKNSGYCNNQGPDLQNIIRQSQDYLRTMTKLKTILR